MQFLLDQCSFYPLSKDILDACQDFDCNNSDLNDFFLHDSLQWSEELITRLMVFDLIEFK